MHVNVESLRLLMSDGPETIIVNPAGKTLHQEGFLILCSRKTSSFSEEKALGVHEKAPQVLQFTAPKIKMARYIMRLRIHLLCDNGLAFYSKEMSLHAPSA